MHEADPENIADIVRRARLGDSAAFTVLYESYVTPLYRYIRSRVSEKADAEDLTQDVFLKAYTSFPRYVTTNDSPLPYFYTIARNSIIDHYRKKKSVVADEDVLGALPDTDDSPEEIAAKREDQTAALRLIKTLPNDQQDALILRFVEGLPTEKIAMMMGKSEAAIRQMQSRGLRSLKNAFNSHNHSP
jgi:RNA polymerase sigma-70 factor, ECF subfamily